MGGDGLDHAICRLLDAVAAPGGNADIGQRIDRFALGQQPLQRAARVGGLQQRPRRALADAVPQRFKVAIQPDRNAALPDLRPVLGAQPGAAPVEITLLPEARTRPSTSNSRARKNASPSRAKISGMLMAAARTISASVSTKGRCSRRASSPPMAVFPAPIIPIITMFRRITCPNPAI